MAFITRVKTWQKILSRMDQCTPVEVCLKRIRERGREEEKGITLEYLRQIEELHDPRAIILDGTHYWRPEEVLELLQALSEQR